jgi:uncharacterized protein YlzI (FlbEa/FlbD family)
MAKFIELNGIQGQKHIIDHSKISSIDVEPLGNVVCVDGRRIEVTESLEELKHKINNAQFYDQNLID